MEWSPEIVWLTAVVGMFLLGIFFYTLWNQYRRAQPKPASWCAGGGLLRVSSKGDNDANTSPATFGLYANKTPSGNVTGRFIQLMGDVLAVDATITKFHMTNTETISFVGQDRQTKKEVQGTFELPSTLKLKFDETPKEAPEHLKDSTEWNEHLTLCATLDHN